MQELHVADLRRIVGETAEEERVWERSAGLGGTGQALSRGLLSGNDSAVKQQQVTRARDGSF